MKELWALYLVFAKIGTFTFGGGYSMLPLIQREIVEKRGWATEEELLDYFAVAQCTPGVIAVNTSTFVGYKHGGVAGGICATAGVVTPSIIIISLVAGILNQYADLPVVAHALAGIRVAVIALVVQAVIKMWKNAVKDGLGVVLFFVAFVLAAFVKISTVWIVILAVIAGLAAQAVYARSGDEEAKK